MMLLMLLLLLLLKEKSACVQQPEVVSGLCDVRMFRCLGYLVSGCERVDIAFLFRYTIKRS